MPFVLVLKYLLANFSASGEKFSANICNIPREIAEKQTNSSISRNAPKINSDGEVNYHKARTLSGAINGLAREEVDPIKTKFYRNMAQIACVPHVKFNALWACGFTIALINMLYAGDLDAVRKERQAQIELLKGVTE